MTEFSETSYAEHARLVREAQRRRTSKSAILREAFFKQAGATKETLADSARHLIGSVDGPGDLSRKSKAIASYGRSCPR